jgi:hypothetical protein
MATMVAEPHDDITGLASSRRHAWFLPYAAFMLVSRQCDVFISATLLSAR